MKGQGIQARVHYKGAEEDFVVIAEDADIVKKWRSDKTIPLVDVVNSFDIFTTGKQGAQGKMDRPSKGTLENEFGTHNEDDIVKKILEEGTVQETMTHDKQGSKNESMGARNNF